MAGPLIRLNKERKLRSHPTVHEVREPVADHGDCQNGDVVPKQRNLAKQRRANDLDKIEQNVKVDEELAIAGDRSIIPEYRRHKEGKLQKVADDEIDIAKSRADKAEDSHNPESVDEQQDDSGYREQAGPADRNQEER